MIKVWFNERGFHIESPKGQGDYLYDVPDSVLNDAAALYTFRWVVFNHAMQNVQFLCDNSKDWDLALYTDSRLIEELQDEITPDNNFARSSLRYFLLYDSAKFKRVDSRKCSASTINSRLGIDDKSHNPTT